MSIPAFPPSTALVALALIAGAVVLGWHDPTVTRTLVTTGSIALAAALEGMRRSESKGAEGGAS